jgi:hypothetical protein
LKDDLKALKLFLEQGLQNEWRNAKEQYTIDADFQQILRVFRDGVIEDHRNRPSDGHTDKR